MGGARPSEREEVACGRRVAGERQRNIMHIMFQGVHVRVWYSTADASLHALTEYVYYSGSVIMQHNNSWQQTPADYLGCC